MLFYARKRVILWQWLGSLTYDTKIDKSGFEKGLNSITNSVKSGGTKIKDIISALGITQLIGKAINIINNSVDGAVSRIDTLNNFPKVMSNLGIASEDSEKAVKKLSDGLQGIPTTLDDASLSVQRFTSVNENVDKSTEYFLALNNALLAGGASADIQSTAMEQLSQAYSKGKPDMMEWRSIQTAMPAQLKQISKELLGNKDNLSKFLKKAEEYADSNPLSSTAKELIEQLEEVKSGSGDMTTALGTALRTGIISMDDFMNTITKMNKEGTEEFKSFEEQAKNSTGGIQTSIANMKTAITRGVAKIIEAFDDMLKNNGLGGISAVISKIGSIAEKILSGIAKKLPSIVSFLEKALPLILGIIAGLTAYRGILLAIQAVQFVQSIVGTISAFMSLIPAIKSAKDAMLLLNMAFSANPIGLIVGAIAALIAILVVLYNKSETFRNSVNKAFETVKNSIMKAWEKIKPSLEKLAESFGKLLEKLGPVGELLINGLGKGFELLGNVLAFIIDILAEVIVWLTDFISSSIEFWTQTIPNAIQKFIYFISQLPQKIKDYLVNGWNNIVTFFTEGIPNFINSIIQWFQELPYKIGYLIGEILGNVVQFGINLGNWITTELPLLINEIINWFAELPGNILNWLLNTLNNIITWGQDAYSAAITWASNTINAIIDWFAQLPGRMWNFLLNTLNNLVQWGYEMGLKGGQAALDLVNKIVDTVKELPGKMLEIGKNIVEGIWNGITGMGNWIGDKVSGFFGGIVDGAKKSLGIQSPSRVFRDKVGKFIPQGVAVGIEADTDKAVEAINNMNDEIYRKMQNAVAVETGAINAKASVKANNSMLNVIQAKFNIDGSVAIDGQKAGRILAPAVTKTIKAGGLA